MNRRGFLTGLLAALGMGRTATAKDSTASSESIPASIPGDARYARGVLEVTVLEVTGSQHATLSIQVSDDGVRWRNLSGRPAHMVAQRQRRVFARSSRMP